MTEKLYLEDFYPGQKFSTQSALVTEAEIKEFAQKFDPQPFHLDDDDARATEVAPGNWTGGLDRILPLSWR